MSVIGVPYYCYKLLASPDNHDKVVHIIKTLEPEADDAYRYNPDNLLITL